MVQRPHISNDKGKFDVSCHDPFKKTEETSNLTSILLDQFFNPGSTNKG